MLGGMNLVVGIVFIFLALFLLVVGGMATAGKLPGNSAIGLRVASVRKDKAVWDQAHKVTGPFVVFAGVALAFGAAFAFIASGWLWIAPVIALIIAVVALSVGGNVGARTAALIDASRDESGAETEPAAPAPAVNLDALRNAASRADKQTGESRNPVYEQAPGTMGDVPGAK